MVCGCDGEACDGDASCASLRLYCDGVGFVVVVVIVVVGVVGLLCVVCVECGRVGSVVGV